MVTTITPHSITESGPGTTPNNCIGVSFLNVGTADASVNGQPLPQNASISFGGRSVEGILEPIAYNATGTEIRIDYETVDI